MTKLFIICGHGAGDPGAAGNGYTEAERVRALASKIKNLGGDSVTVGDTNKNWYKSNLVNHKNIPKGSKVLELHMDSSVASARGGHVIINADLTADVYDRELASFIGMFMPGRSNTLVKRNDLANPNRAQAAGINYRLLECGFISNEEDVRIFTDKMEELAAGILKCFHIETGTVENLSEYEGNSIVDYLNSIGKASDFASRRIYAKQYGISGYSGTADQNLKLLQMIRGTSEKKENSDYYPKYTGNSYAIDEVLAFIGVPKEYRGSWKKRRNLAERNNIRAYTGSASQNSALIALAREGQLKKL